MFFSNELPSNGLRRLAVDNSSVQQEPGAAELVMVFAKVPLAGVAKTRLAARVGERNAAECAQFFLADTLDRLRNWGRCPIRLLGAADSIAEFAEWIETSGLQFESQESGHLGNRMQAAFASAFAAGYSRVLALGADTPHLPRRILQDSFDALGPHSACVGPAGDGGYYLLGLGSEVAAKALFAADDWGKPSVLKRTMASLQQVAQGCHLLPELNDFDEVADLQAFLSATDVAEAEMQGFSRSWHSAKRAVEAL